jgi:hypothetical protein
MSKTNTTVDSNLQAFADAVLAKVATIPVGNPLRFGRYKVLVAALAPSKATKALLLRAHQAGLLVLTRADMSFTMDQKLVAESEITYLNAQWHFVSPVGAS